MTTPASASPVRRRLAWFLRPAPAFVAMQIVPLLLWLVLPDAVFGIALQGYERAPVTVAGLMAFGLICLAFSTGSWLGERAGATHQTPWGEYERRTVTFLHYVALALTAFSTGMVLRIVFTAGIDVIALLLASQANQVKS